MTILGTVASSFRASAASAYEFIAKAVTTSSVSSVTISSLSTSYTHMLIYVSGAPTPSNEISLIFEPNSTSANQNRSAIYIRMTTSKGFFTGDPLNLIDYSLGAKDDQWGIGEIIATNYSGGQRKGFLTQGVQEYSILGGGTDNQGPGSLGAGQFNNTAAITAFTFKPTSSGNFTSGVSFTIYGLKSA